MVGTLHGRVVLVGGVGTGLGSAVVSLLASEGATVVAVARKAAALEPLAAHARSRGWKVAPRTADVADPADVERLAQGVISEFGGIDALSVNVGHWIGGDHLLHEMTPDEWTAGVRDNLDATYQLGRAVLPHMVQRGRGSVVVVAASLAVRWAAGASYTAGKGGLIDLIPKLARDYRPTGVRFNAVLPGSMGKSPDSLDPPAPGTRVALRDETTTSPWEVARVIRFLVSDESSWMTGALLTIDGGASTFGTEPKGEE